MIANPSLFEATIIGFGSPFYDLQSPTSEAGFGTRGIVTVQDEIVLSGLSLASVSGETYTTNAAGGVLSLQSGTSTIALQFVGNYSLADFALSAASQAYSTSPPGVVISDPIIHVTAAMPTIDAPGDNTGHWFSGTLNVLR